MSQVFFTADTHFNHPMVIPLSKRPFASVEEMNEAIVDRWNSRVKRGDRVYHLGDVALGKVQDAAEILHRLNGQIFLLRGNHDKVAEHKSCRDRFVWIKDYFGLKVGDQKIVLCHYAFRTWNNIHYGSWNLHGHSHGGLTEQENLPQCDVGVDCWDFYPVSFEEIQTKMATKKFVPVDHHAAEFTPSDRNQTAPCESSQHPRQGTLSCCRCQVKGPRAGKRSLPTLPPPRRVLCSFAAMLSKFCSNCQTNQSTSR